MAVGLKVCIVTSACDREQDYLMGGKKNNPLWCFLQLVNLSAMVDPLLYEGLPYATTVSHDPAV